MCGEDSHLESDYEDRYGISDYLGDSDDFDDYDGYDEEDETDNEDDSPIGVATFEVVGYAVYDPETDKLYV